eukprot:TRINITY_DN609_c0_g1_i11.p3 TRINITY_DN609_c0_g1~~TRINITY_DN609_c0_g1_i11.p3  ORF type:complete len:100 (-),score=24.90 TRINITY_DN609_c0_g1_i11:482-781(-)
MIMPMVLLLISPFSLFIVLLFPVLSLSPSLTLSVEQEVWRLRSELEDVEQEKDRIQNTGKSMQRFLIASLEDATRECQLHTEGRYCGSSSFMFSPCTLN